MNELPQTVPQLVFDYLQNRGDEVNPLLIADVVRIKQAFYATRPEWFKISPIDQQFTLFSATITQLVQDYDLKIPLERAADETERKTYIGHLSKR